MLIKNLDAGIGWKRLKNNLQVLQGVMNKNAPLQGDGITLHETETGTIISAERTTPEGVKPQWLPVDVMDDKCVRSTIWVWGTTKKPF